MVIVGLSLILRNIAQQTQGVEDPGDGVPVHAHRLRGGRLRGGRSIGWAVGGGLLVGMAAAFVQFRIGPVWTQAAYLAVLVALLVVTPHGLARVPAVERGVTTQAIHPEESPMPPRRPRRRLPVTGPMQSADGKHMQQGADLAADQINNGGGIRAGRYEGARISMQYLDDSDKVPDSVTNANKVASDDTTWALLGSGFSDGALATRP